jgi:hypothetical protein
MNWIGLLAISILNSKMSLYSSFHDATAHIATVARPLLPLPCLKSHLWLLVQFANQIITQNVDAVYLKDPSLLSSMLSATNSVQARIYPGKIPTLKKG